MSHGGYLVVPYNPAEVDEYFEESNVGIIGDVSQLSLKLKKQWPLAELRISEEVRKKWILGDDVPTLQMQLEKEKVLWWKLPPEKNGDALSGHFSGITLGLGTFPHKSIEIFLIWYRTIIPNTISLYLFSNDPDEFLLINPETSASEIRTYIENN